VAVALASGLALGGVKRKSLSTDGAVAAFVVGFSALLASYRFGFTLLVFYWTSSKLTKFKSDLKRMVEGGYREGGQRNWRQVLNSSLPGVIIALVYLARFQVDGPLLHDGERSLLLAAYLGFFACTNGDTWASEIGIVAGLRSGSSRLSGSPLLAIPPFRKVPRGTNGGISLVGTIASLAGGAVIGLAYFLLGLPFTPGHLMISQARRNLWLGTFGGGFGSWADSVLGATLQASWYDEEAGVVLAEIPPQREKKKLKHITGVDLLSNEQINLLSACFTALVCSWLQSRF